jgi:hypothetical protein
MSFGLSLTAAPIVIHRALRATVHRSRSASPASQIDSHWKANVSTAARTAITAIRSGKSACHVPRDVPPVAATSA